MSENHVSLIDRTAQETHVLLRDIREAIGGGTGASEMYHALKGVLHTLRDRLTIEEAVHLSQQMPTMVRGIYFEGYRPTGKPDVFRHREEFIRRVDAELSKTGGNLSGEIATTAVLTALYQHMDRHELDHVRDMLNEEIRELFPKAA
ncbi:MAG: DUF2267 domain-containing protein [Opitutales bacterium]